MISGVDNYRRAIEFKRPEYLPWTLGVGLEWMNEKNEAKAERKLNSLRISADGGKSASIVSIR
jgi:hypothetical protein